MRYEVDMGCGGYGGNEVGVGVGVPEKECQVQYSPMVVTALMDK